MKKRWIVLISVAVLFAVTMMSLRWIVNQWLKSNVDGRIVIKSLYLNPFNGTVFVGVLGVIPEQFSFDLQRLKINLKLTDLIKKKITIEQIKSVRGELNLDSGNQLSWGRIYFKPIYNSTRPVVSVLLDESGMKIDIDSNLIVSQFTMDMGSKGQIIFNGRIESQGLELNMPPDDGPLAYQWEQIHTDSKSNLHYKDNSLSPPFDVSISSFLINISSLNSRVPTMSTTMRLTGKLSEYNEIQFNASGTPLEKLPSLYATASIYNAELLPFNPLFEKYIGYRIESGTLFLNSTMTVTHGKIKGENDLLLKKLKLDRLKKSEKDPWTEQLGVPLNTFLMTLRDKDKNIRLKIPIEGDLNNPEIKWGDALRKASLKGAKIAITNTIETAFPILKVARLTKMVAGFALKLRFDPLLFDPGKSEIRSESLAYLDEVGQKLSEKEGVELRLCAQIAQSDVKLLGASDEEAQLNLGKQRAERVRKYLIDKFKINHERLFICTPEIDKEKSEKEPRVEIRL